MVYKNFIKLFLFYYSYDLNHTFLYDFHQNTGIFGIFHTWFKMGVFKVNFASFRNSFAKDNSENKKTDQIAKFFVTFIS